jgi:DNA-binding transcriptional LysR family regulator
MTAPPPFRPILIRGLDDALAAAAAADSTGNPLVLMAPPAAGALWLRGVVERVRGAHPGLEVAGLLDCGDRAGETQGALAAGLQLVLFTGRPDMADRLSAIAAARGAALLTRCPPALDLAATTSPEGRGPRRAAALEALCSEWLSRDKG